MSECGSLPGCMEPDGAEPCGRHKRQFTELALLREVEQAASDLVANFTLGYRTMMTVGGSRNTHFGEIDALAGVKAALQKLDELREGK